MNYFHMLSLRTTVLFLFIALFCFLNFIPTSVHAASLDVSSCEDSCNKVKGLSSFGNTSACQADASCGSCVNQILANSQLTQYCKSLDALKAAKKSQLPVIVAYGASAATCAAACAFTWAGGDAVCTGATIAVGLTELIAKAAFNTEVEASLNSFTGALMGGAIFGGIKGAQYTAGKLGADATSQWLGKNQSCVAAAILTTVGALRRGNRRKVANSEKKTCEDITQLTNTELSLTSCLTKIPAPQSAAIYSAIDASDFNIENETELQPEAESSGVLAANDLLNEIRKQIKSNPQAGKKYNEFSKRLANGESLASVMGGLNGVSSDFQEKFAALEKNVEKSFLGSGIGSYASGKGNAKMGKNKGFTEIAFGFNKDATQGTDPISEIGFEGKKRTPSSWSEDDIFHSGFHGTIFEIVSQSIVNQKPNVQASEPVLPLNRALAGLKNESPIKKQGKTKNKK